MNFGLKLSIMVCGFGADGGEVVVDVDDLLLIFVVECHDGRLCDGEHESCEVGRHGVSVVVRESGLEFRVGLFHDGLETDRLFCSLFLRHGELKGREFGVC